MKKPKLFDAIEWIVMNDMPEEGEAGTGHIATCLVADLFGLEVDKVLMHVRQLHAEITEDLQ
jgi:hypothetical protein